MKNTDFMNLSLPEGTDKIDIEILNNDFTAIENLLKQHAIIETMTLNGEGVIIGAIGPYIRLQNIDTVQVSIDIGKETYTLASGENVIIRETAENIGIITSGNVHITYFVNPITYADKEFYSKKKVDELLSKVEGNVEVDAELSETSENPVQNKVITAELASYATTAEVESKVTEKVAEIVARAPEDFDTLKEMSDWLKEHEDSAASMNSAIQKNAENIATANANIAKKLDKTTKYAISDDVGGAANLVKTTITSVDANRVVYFGDSTNGVNGGSTKTGVDSDFYYNPATKKLNVKNIVSDTTNSLVNQATINKTALGLQCKNLLKPTITSKTLHGITITVNEDGTITATGTPTETTVFNVGSIELDAGTYIVSGCPDGGSYENTYRLDAYFNEMARFYDYGSGIKMPLSGVRYVTIRIVIWAGAGEVNLTFAPMVRYADVTDNTYEPYTPSLQKQINTLLARIEALEGATTTTEGGV